MKNLYIDFDGVILDTITVTYRMMNELNIDKKDSEAIRKFYYDFDWKQGLKEIPVLNDSINMIKLLEKSEKFRIFVLTHVISLKEGVEKIKYLKKLLPNVSVIIVPKELEKIMVVNPNNSILVDDYSGNLRIWKNHGGISIKFSLKEESNEFPVISSLDKILDIIYQPNI